MMSLQALKDELAHADDQPWTEPWPYKNALEVARRVAALYDTCPSCDGCGFYDPDGAFGESYTCNRCGGIGMVASETGWLHPAEIGPFFDPASLARYLFGKEG
jgi:hypothetical protein